MFWFKYSDVCKLKKSVNDWKSIFVESVEEGEPYLWDSNFVKNYWNEKRTFKLENNRRVEWVNSCAYCIVVLVFGCICEKCKVKFTYYKLKENCEEKH